MILSFFLLFMPGTIDFSSRINVKVKIHSIQSLNIQEYPLLNLIIATENI